MKKCKKCGAVQSDDRSTCVDCGTVLGRPMDEAEEAQAEAALDDRLDGLAERAQDFYVSIPEKVMGILCIIAVVAAVVMLNLVGVEKTSLDKQVPDYVMMTSAGGAFITATAFDPETGELYDAEIPQSWYTRHSELEDAGLSALVGLIACVGAAPMLLVPRFMWWLDTLKYRLWYEWEPSPTYFATVVRKGMTYLLFAMGLIGVIYSYFLYFG